MAETENHLESAEFKRILDIGLGRAILYLQNHDSTPHRDAILNACLHNTAMDRQVEGTRSQYMTDVVRLTGDMEFYREQVFSALSAGGYDDYDTQHQLVFASILAGEGDERARQIVYDTIQRNIDDDILPLVLINMDGLQGFTFIVERLLETQREVSDLDFTVEHLIDVLEDRDGIKQTQRKLKQYIAQNPQAAPLIQAAFSRREQGKQAFRKRRNPEHFSYEDVKIWMDSPDTLKSPPVHWVVWGQHSTVEELDRAAQDFLQVDDADTRRIWAYVQIFRDRVFPLEPDRLIEWAKHLGEKPIRRSDGTVDHEARMPYYALSSLSLLTHPKVRAFALSMIEQSKEAGRVVRLLAANYQKGDWQFIASLTSQNLDNEDYHSLEYSVEDVFKAHPSDEAIPALTNLYEHGPTSTCRRRVVQYLDSLDAVPDWMREECRYDSNADLREFARQYF